MLKFQNKTILVTGSGTGIGQAITKKFVEWKVYVEDIFVIFVTEPKNKDE